MSSIYRKLVAYFLLINLLAIGTDGLYSYFKEKEALLSRTFDQLISVRQEEENRIIAFFGYGTGNPEYLQQYDAFGAQRVWLAHSAAKSL